MKNIIVTLVETLKSNQDAVLVTTVESTGSTPRGAGAHMLITNKENQLGTIGGGMLEFKALEIGRQCLQAKKSHLEFFRLSPNDIADLGMICGGDVKVFFQYFSHTGTQTIHFLENLALQWQYNQDLWLIIKINHSNSWEMFAYGNNTQLPGSPPLSSELIQKLIAAKSVLLQTADGQYFSEPVIQAGYVYIFGGGHVAQELVPTLHRVNFQTIIADDRGEFVSPALFPLAKNTLLVDYKDLTRFISVRQCDYIAIMTRGHQNDYEVLSQALRTPARYIGLIGSRTKIKKTYERLYKDGFTQEDIKRIHTPIGIEIAAETPAEIAVSIAAEMIRVRAVGQ